MSKSYTSKALGGKTFLWVSDPKWSNWNPTFRKEAELSAYSSFGLWFPSTPFSFTSWLPSNCPLTGNWTQNLGTGPDLELNLQTFDVQDDSPTNWSTQPGLDTLFVYAALLFSKKREMRRLMRHVIVYNFLRILEFKPRYTQCDFTWLSGSDIVKRIRRPKFQSWLCHLLAVLPWGSLASLCCNFLISEMRINK